MTLYQLKIIYTLISNDLSVSVTADKMHRAQSAISHQLHLLEEEFGGKLFERAGKRLVKPTSLCREVLPKIDLILQAEDAIQTTKEEYMKKDYGDLRVATTYTQARYFLPTVVKQFREQYPHVKFIFFQDNPLKFPEMLRRKEIDFAIYAEDLDADIRLNKVVCYRWNRSMVTLRDHPLAAVPRPKLADVAAYPMITYIPGFSDRMIIEQTFKKANIDIDIIFSASDTEVIKTYVRLGLGIGILAQMAYNPVTDNQLVFHDLSHLFKDSVTRVIYPQGKALRGYMIDFIELLQERGKQFQAKME